MNKGITVLSLFDGISCGQIALQRVGIKIDKYFASEIDKHAIKVTQHNWPETVQLGDVTKWREWDIEWSEIDVLTAGFPCQAWSFAGKQKGVEDPRGALALVLFDIFTFLKEKNPDLKFLFENVKMKKEYSQYLDKLFGVKSILINSALVSAQNRNRLYWTNISGVTQPKDKNIKLCDILEKEDFNEEPYNEKYQSNIPIEVNEGKFKTLRANAGSRTRGIGLCNNKGWWRKLTPIECERLQTVEYEYTSRISNTQRYKALGNGWTVDVIAHIFKGLKNEV